jgi:serine/threonine protein kinase
LARYAHIKYQVVGSGSFGVVFSATIAETGEAVAVKKVCRSLYHTPVHLSLNHSSGFAGQAIQESRVTGDVTSFALSSSQLRTNACPQIMKSLRHQNVVHLKHCFFSNNEKDELCDFVQFVHSTCFSLPCAGI